MEAEAYLGVVLAVAASFAQIALHFYLQLTQRLMGWHWRGVRSSISRIDIHAVRHGREVVRSIDGAVSASWRIMLAVHLLPLVFVAIPLALTFGSLALAASIISVPAG